MHVVRVRRKMRRVALQTAVAMALPILLGWLAIEMPLDRRVELSRLTRTIFLGGALSLVAVVLWLNGVRPWRRRTSEDEIALLIERAVPSFRSRFIASIQLTRRPSE